MMKIRSITLITFLIIIVVCFSDAPYLLLNSCSYSVSDSGPPRKWCAGGPVRSDSRLHILMLGLVSFTFETRLKHLGYDMGLS